jgi:hypothetical protein
MNMNSSSDDPFDYIHMVDPVLSSIMLSIYPKILGGRRTLLIIWIMPFLAIMSAITIIAGRSYPSKTVILLMALVTVKFLP